MGDASTSSAADSVPRRGLGEPLGRLLGRLTSRNGPLEPSNRTPGLRQAGVRLAGYLWPRRWAVGLGVTAFFVSAAIEPLLPALLKRLLDDGFKPDLGFPLWTVPLAVIGLFVLRGLTTFAGAFLFAWSTSHAVLALRGDLVRALLRADASLFASLSPGVAAARIINDPQNATQSLAGALTTLLRDGTSLIALLAYLAWLDWRLTLVSLLTVPVLALVVRFVQRRIVAVGGRTYESQIRLTGIVDDIARAWRVVRSFDAGDFEWRRFESEARKLRHCNVKAMATGALMGPLTQLVASVGIAMILTLAISQAQGNGATVGGFVAFLTAMLMTISPMRHLADLTQPVVTGLIQARACFELIDTQPEPDTGRREIEQARGHIRLEDVRVQYPGQDRPAVDGLDLDVPAGSTIALVGPSGAGKSTIVNAMLGFVAPSRGRVTFDGVDLVELRKASLRRQFAVVSQDIVLFDGSVAANVAYGQPLDDERVRECLRSAHLLAFVDSLPQGLAAQIGTNGSRLSGGQRQRLAIARALYKDAAVWVFDEATSALDTDAERAVHRAVSAHRGSRTLVLIAHRLSTVRHADCIAVLDHGCVAEAGSHAALMERGGLYAAMVKAQDLR